MAKSTTTRRNPNWLTATRRNVAELGQYRVQVGWSDKMGADPETVTIAAYNVLGTDTIPARDVLTPTLTESLASVRNTNAAAVRAANRGADPLPLLEAMAARLEQRLKDNIDAATPENADSTADAKGLNDPLIGAGSDKGRIFAQAAARVLKR